MDDDDKILLLKIIAIFALFFLCFFFGILPYCIETCRTNYTLLSYANTFSGGLFFGIGVFHILPESVTVFLKYTELPIPYFLAFGAYSLILFIQKVIFGYMNVDDIEKTRDPKLSKEIALKVGNNEDPDSSINLEIIKPSIPEEENKEVPLVETEKKEDNKDLQSKKLSGYVMLLALSIHGVFECLALGIQSTVKNTLFLFIALMIHKWAEAFSLGIFFVKGQLSKKFYMILITLFSLIGPVGLVIGIILSATTSELVEGIFLAISTGTFLYVSCSEVIIEEFSGPERRYIKFLLFLIGGAFAVGLTLFEYFFE